MIVTEVKIASIMQLYKGAYSEYKKRHDNLWPEMKKGLKEYGVSNYSIFLEEHTGQLFAYVEVRNKEKWKQFANTSICQKWWKYMKPLMHTNKDNSPVSKDLVQVFYLE